MRPIVFASRCLVVRRLATPTEFNAALRIRLDRYRSAPDLWRLVAGPNGARDRFDPVSEHYGVFGGTGAWASLLGAVRLTEAVRREGRSTPLLPLLAFTPSPAHDEVLDRIERVRSRRGRAFEISRLVIDEELVRVDPGMARRALLALVAGLAAEIQRRSQIGECFVTCSERRAPCYRRFGFEFLERGSSVLTPLLGRRSRLLVATPAHMPASLAARIAARDDQGLEPENRTSKSYSSPFDMTESAPAA